MRTVRPFLTTALLGALLAAHVGAHAASFNCNKGRSLTEKIICHDPALSRLDDTLGQLYWKARRRVTDRRGFITDSDSKWAWREANCKDADCLGTWYSTRIEELERLIASMRTGVAAETPDGGAEMAPLEKPVDASAQAPKPVRRDAGEAPAETAEIAKTAATAETADPAQTAQAARSAEAASALKLAPHSVDGAMLQCTAAHPGLVVGEQCPTVIRHNPTQWKYQPHGGDWFCGVAMLGRT